MRYALIVLLLAGCASGGKTAEEMAIEDHGKRCERIGYTPGTDAHRDCIVKYMTRR
jgi:hypothetical protein